MNKSEHIINLSVALSRSQGEMPAVPFDSTNPFLKNRFASLGAIIEHSRLVLAKHGLAICQFPISENGKVGIESMLIHESGEWLSERILLPLSEEKGKSLAQVAGSITTYLKRYSWASILGVYAEEDTDGNGHGEIPKRQPTVLGKPGPSTPGPEPQLKPTALETDEQKLARFLKFFEPYGPYATEVFRREEFVLPTEGYMDISASMVSRFKKSQVDALFKDVKRCAGAFDDAPEPENLPHDIAGVIVPIPRKGLKRDEYLKSPDTIGSLYAASSDDEEAARRLFGFVSNFQPAPWVGRDGKQRPPSDSDVKFREALDRFSEWRKEREK